ncbi:MAG: class E sortase [Bowdeniella nasicola]|nr:class E sortase [Bowdeniella nasicola]
MSQPPRRQSLQQPAHLPPQPPAPMRESRRPHRSRRGIGDWIITIVGELLVTAGIFIGLFLLWQMWYTNIEAAENNRVAAEQLETQFVDPVQKKVEPAQRHTDLPPPVKSRGLNEPYAKLYIPSWGTDYMVAIAEGLSYTQVLNHGLVGHYPDTNAIGELGNAGLAAHRMTRGAVFQDIETLNPGDEVIVESEDSWIVFTVESTEIVNPNQGEVLLPVPHKSGEEPQRALLTLTTCHPLMSTRERYIVYTEFSYWIDRADGMPDALLEDN